MQASSKRVDVVVVGAGIVGLAHAYEAHQRGYSVLVIEKNARCTGASIRNFGFITVSGQRSGDTWRRARQSRDVWNAIAPQVGIAVVHRGSWVACHRDEAVDVAGAFMRTDMAEGCRLFHKSDFSRLLGEFPETASLLLEDMRALLYSPLEMRVESRDAIPQLAQWLSEEKGIGFQWSTEVLHVEDGIVHTAKESIHADCIVVCPGAELTGIAKGAMEGYTTEQCTLQMLRIRPAKPIALPGSVMTDNSLARYHGWADLPEAAPLKKRIRYEMPEYLAAGIHLIAVQSADGSLVLGDSHVYGASESVFSSVDSDRLILNLAQSVVDLGRFDVIERWNGVYPVWAGGDAVIHRMSAKTVVTVVTSGTGASTAFGLAKDTFNTLE